MTKEKLIPQLRFKGFEGEWEETTFGSILNYERPDKYIVENDDYDNEGIPVLTANKSFILGYTHEDNFYNKGASIIFDDFTLDSKYVDFKYKVKSSALKILTSKYGDLRFIYELLSRTPINQEGHSRHYISVVQPFKIKVTELQEQQKIGSFFEKLDKLIELYQNKVKLKVHIKNHSLKKIIQFKGTPLCRFDGFKNDWVQLNLDKMFNYYNGNTLENRIGSGDYKVINLNSVSMNGNLKDSGKRVSNISGIKVLNKGDLVMILSDIAHGNLVGRTAVIDFNDMYVLNQRVARLEPKQNVDSEYMHVFLNSSQRRFKVLSSGTSQLNISKNSVLSFKINAPSLPEQQKIGQLFQKLDQEINLYEQKIEHLKQLKKGYLQKLFC